MIIYTQAMIYRWHSIEKKYGIKKSQELSKNNSYSYTSMVTDEKKINQSQYLQ